MDMEIQIYKEVLTDKDREKLLDEYIRQMKKDLEEGEKRKKREEEVKKDREREVLLQRDRDEKKNSQRKRTFRKRARS